MSNTDSFASSFSDIPSLIASHAARDPDKVAVLDDQSTEFTYGQLAQAMESIAGSLHQHGVDKGDCVAICASASARYLAAYLGALRAGATVAPLSPSTSKHGLALQMSDSGPKVVFIDQGTAGYFESEGYLRFTLDDSAGDARFLDLIAGHFPSPDVVIGMDDVCHIIYSSGTTGTPKGILQSHGMRWAYVWRAPYPRSAVSLISTPLYSNTTFSCITPTLAAGGTLIIMSKFDAANYLRYAERYRATHTMLVPLQYRRLMEFPHFDGADVSSLRTKYATSSPFSAELKREVLARWSGELFEIYGMTEGGGSCRLEAHHHPDKLHTVGRPAKGAEFKVLDQHGGELPAGEVGELVGRSPAMMLGYRNQPEKTAEVEWRDAEGRRFFRTGDLGRFDEDGFLNLVGRAKDVIISGGFNIYPIDIEEVICGLPEVLEAAVVGVPSAEWGESPVGFVVARPETLIEPEVFRHAVNSRLGKTQRLVEVRVLDKLPRCPLGKILKRELRDDYIQGQ